MIRVRLTKYDVYDPELPSLPQSSKCTATLRDCNPVAIPGIVGAQIAGFLWLKHKMVKTVVMPQYVLTTKIPRFGRRQSRDCDRIGQDYCIGTAWKMSVDIDTTPDLLFLIKQKLHIVQYWWKDYTIGAASHSYWSYFYPLPIATSWNEPESNPRRSGLPALLPQQNCCYPLG